MVKELKSYLTPSTWIPLGFVMSIMGGMFAVSFMFFTVKANAEEIKVINVDLKEVQLKNTELEKRFEKFQVILERLDKRTEFLDNVDKVSFQ